MIGVIVVIPLIALAIAITFTLIQLAWSAASTIGPDYSLLMIAAVCYGLFVFIPTLIGWSELASAWLTRCAAKAAGEDCPVAIECNWADYDKWTGVYEVDSVEKGKVTYFCPLPCILIKISWNGVTP